MIHKPEQIVNNTSHLFQPNSMIHEIVIEQEQRKVVEDVQPINIQDIAFQKHNKLMPDGRIFGGYDEDGRYYAVTVSPYFSEFESQIEEGIRPLVSAIRDKGYLTCSSCYGHPKRAMVVVCFPTARSREEFTEVVRKESIPTLAIEYRDSMVNVGVSTDRRGRVQFSKDLEFDHSFEGHRSMEVASFNGVFLRNYDDYFFLHITVLDDYHPIFQPIKAYKTRKYLPEKDMLLKKLTNLILSDKIKYFKQ